MMPYVPCNPPPRARSLVLLQVASAEWDVLQITTTGGRVLRISPEHILPVNTASNLVRARTVKPGDVLYGRGTTADMVAVRFLCRRV